MIGQESTSFGAVPLTEYINNENRTGDWESKLDEIDAYDPDIAYKGIRIIYELNRRKVS